MPEQMSSSQSRTAGTVTENVAQIAVGQVDVLPLADQGCVEGIILAKTSIAVKFCISLPSASMMASMAPMS